MCVPFAASSYATPRVGYGKKCDEQAERFFPLDVR